MSHLLYIIFIYINGLQNPQQHLACRWGYKDVESNQFSGNQIFLSFFTDSGRTGW